MTTARVKYNLGQQVRWRGKPYKLTACIIRIRNGVFYYQGELQDAKARSSLIIADLKEIEEDKT